jgi:hypothetical protein
MIKSKIVQFTTTDGRKFYGADSKSEATEHEKDCKNKFDKAVYESTVGRLLIKDWPEFDGKFTSIEEFWSHVNFDICDNKWNKFIKGFSQAAVCPDDLEEFGDVAEMITDVVDYLGGIDNITKILEATKKFRGI